MHASRTTPAMIADRSGDTFQEELTGGRIRWVTQAVLEDRDASVRLSEGPGTPSTAIARMYLISYGTLDLDGTLHLAGAWMPKLGR